MLLGKFLYGLISLCGTCFSSSMALRCCQLYSTEFRYGSAETKALVNWFISSKMSSVLVLWNW